LSKLAVKSYGGFKRSRNIRTGVKWQSVMYDGDAVLPNVLLHAEGLRSSK